MDLNSWLPYGVRITYTPSAYFTGNDSITFLLNDGQDNSTAARVDFKVNPVDNAPVAIDGIFEMLTGQNKTIQLQATDIDTAPQDLRFYLIDTPQYGYASIDGKHEGVLTYEAINPGKEVLRWQVSDGTAFVEGTTTIVISM